MIAPLFLVANVADLVASSGPVAKTILVLLAAFSLFSWTVIFSKWSYFGKARVQSDRFLAAFRKGPKAFDLGSVLDQFHPSPLIRLFQAGSAVLPLQAGGGGGNTHEKAPPRGVQLAAGREIAP